LNRDLAICTLPDGRNIDVPLAWLPKDINPGDPLEVSSDGEALVQFSIDLAATQKMLKQNRQVLERLNANVAGGNVTLLGSPG
jgi:hypothetical protein